MLLRKQAVPAGLPVLLCFFIPEVRRTLYTHP